MALAVKSHSLVSAACTTPFQRPLPSFSRTVRLTPEILSIPVTPSEESRRAGAAWWEGGERVGVRVWEVGGCARGATAGVGAGGVARGKRKAHEEVDVGGRGQVRVLDIGEGGVQGGLRHESRG